MVTCIGWITTPCEHSISVPAEFFYVSRINDAIMALCYLCNQLFEQEYHLQGGHWHDDMWQVISEEEYGVWEVMQS